MVAFANCAGANAAQISAVPNCVLDRVTRFQSSPSPETTAVCFCSRLFGPCEETNAISNSPASAVLNGLVTRVPKPSENTVVSRASVGPDPPAGADETTSATAVPGNTCVPLTGDWLITDPAGTVGLAASVTSPTTRVASVMASVASSCVKPTTFGTAMMSGPVETTRFTALPCATCVPEFGVWLITDPDGTVVLDAVVTVPSVRFAFVIAVVAAAWVRPTTFGPAACGGPLDTTRFTALPVATCVPLVGVWLITDPDGTVVLDAVVTVPSVRFAFVIAVVAAAWVRPTTFGTATCGGPLDTTRFTALPVTTCVPLVGVWLITDPDGTVVLDCVVTVPSVRFAFVIAVVAAA